MSEPLIETLPKLPGEVWASDCGDYVLVNADCLEVLPLLPEGGVDAVVTDPPYGVGFKYESHDDSETKYAELITPCVQYSERAVGEGGALFFWQGMRHADRFHAYFPPGFRLFCAAKNFTQHLPTPVQFGWDPVVFWFKGKSERRAICGERDYHIGNTAKFITEPSTGHPCPRPVDTCEYIAGLAANPGQTILDPFTGSGTTGVAAARLGRKFIGIEIEPKYFEIAKKRIQDELTRHPLFEEPKPVQTSLITEGSDES